MAEPTKTFGIPLTTGKLLSKGKYGVVLSFNMRHLYLRTLLRAQLYSDDHQTLTETTMPDLRLLDIFEYPQLENAPELAFAQKAYSAIVFIKSPPIQFSDNTRIIFWFARNAIPVKSMNDFVDVPNHAIPLLRVLLQKKILLEVGKPIPPELEQTIKNEEAKLRKEGNMQNFYLEDTFELSHDEILKLGLEESQIEETRQNSSVGSGDAALKRFTHGELKRKLKKLLKRDNCVQNETVSSVKIAKWVQEVLIEGYHTTESIIRAKLSRMGYTSEKTHKE